MGAILKYFTITTPESLIKYEADYRIERDFKSRQTEEDMYRGDFGSSTYQQTLKLDDLKREQGVTKKRLTDEDIHDIVMATLESQPKYHMVGIITKQLGYAYFTLGVNNIPAVRGGYSVYKPNNYENRSFKNITEMKKFLESTHDVSWYNGLIYTNDTYNLIGRVGFKHFHVYKTKPKKPIAKYKHNSPMVEVTFGGWNPY